MSDEENSFDLIMEVFGSLGDKVERMGMESLNDAERAFYVVAVADTAIAGDGVYALFHVRPEIMAQASEALEVIGLPEQAARFRELIDLMPAPSYDEEERLQQVIAIQEENPALDAKIQELQWLALQFGSHSRGIIPICARASGRIRSYLIATPEA